MTMRKDLELRLMQGESDSRAILKEMGVT